MHMIFSLDSAQPETIFSMGISPMILLYIHKIEKGIYFYFSLFVCVCVSGSEQNADTPLLTI